MTEIKTDPESGNGSYVSVGIAIGLSVGTAVGVAIDSPGLGIGIGMLAGAAGGVSLAAAKSKRGDENENPET